MKQVAKNKPKQKLPGVSTDDVARKINLTFAFIERKTHVLAEKVDENFKIFSYLLLLAYKVKHVERYDLFYAPVVRSILISQELLHMELAVLRTKKSDQVRSTLIRAYEVVVWSYLEKWRDMFNGSELKAFLARCDNQEFSGPLKLANTSVANMIDRHGERLRLVRNKVFSHADMDITLVINIIADTSALDFLVLRGDVNEMIQQCTIAATAISSCVGQRIQRDASKLEVRKNG
jgi:hypothetical protein